MKTFFRLLAYAISELKDIKRHVFLNPSEKGFIRYNRSLRPEKKAGMKDLNILVQMPQHFCYVLIFSSLLRSLQKKFNVRIGWIRIMTAHERTGRFGFLKRNRWYERKWTKLYLSNGGEVDFSNIFYPRSLKPELVMKSEEIFRGLKNKKELVDLKFLDIWIGDLIYDTYLRFKPAATVDLKDGLLKEMIITALHVTQGAQELLKRKKYDYLFTIHNSYIHHAIMVRTFQSKNIPVFAFGSFAQAAVPLALNPPVVTQDYTQYKFLFDQLSADQKVEARKKAEEELSSRFKGRIDSATVYMRQSAYHQESTQERVFVHNGKKRVVVFLHCFFDSPHIFRSLPYSDFMEWIRATLSIAEKTDADFYVKPHPNGIAGNDEIVEQLKKEFPKIRFLSKKISNKQLIDEKFDLAVTVYGTLGHEFPYFNIPVLNAGDNPHITFDFSTHAKSKEEYEHYLRNISSVPQVTEEAKKSILDFYYIHALHPYAGRYASEDAQMVSREFREVRTSDVLTQYVEKSEKDPQYRDRLDDIILKSFNAVLE